MKKLLLLTIVVSSVFAGLFDDNAAMNNPERKYHLNTPGWKTTVYEFTTYTKPRMQCVLVSFQSTNVLQCIRKDKEK